MTTRFGARKQENHWSAWVRSSDGVHTIRVFCNQVLQETRTVDFNLDDGAQAREELILAGIDDIHRSVDY